MEVVPMKKARFADLQDYLALIVRRKAWVIAVFAALCGLTVVVALILPGIYLSQTMILIQPREVPSEFVKDLVSGTTDERLSAIEQTILSRTNLLKVLNEFESQMMEYRGMNDDRKVAKLKSRILVEFPDVRRRGQYLPTTNFRISYRDPNPLLAQRITGRLASLFIEQDSRTRENQVFGTTEFLNTELSKIAQQLHESETRLKTLKEQYRYELPSELETNLRTLDRLQMQKTGNLEALDRYTTMQLNLERQVSETPPTISKDLAAARNVIGSGQRTGSPLVELYRKKEQEYKALAAKATERHPDVLRAKAELEALRKDIPPEELDPSSSQLADEPVQAAVEMVPNPVYQNLIGQLRQMKTEIEIREREKKWIEAEMTLYNDRVQSTPRVEQEIAAVVRNNEDLTRQHEDLKAKHSQAKLSESLESRQKGAQFTVVDPANYPLETASPNPAFLIVVGAFLSLFLAVATAFVVDMASQKVWTDRELERVLGAPVLVEIPDIVTPADAGPQRLRTLAYATASLVSAALYAAGLYYLYVKQAPVLRALDPVIEKLFVERMTN
jgi:polysaccharide chain length determinant protein (PEP-CTERM system associated)